MHKLQRFLIDYDMAMLRALAQNRGIRLTTNRQTDAADQLASALLDPMSLRAALAQLSPAAREALDSLLAAGGKMRAPHFTRRFGQVRPIGSGRLQRDTPWQTPENPTEELWYSGLIYRAFYQDPSGPGAFIFIPDDLRPLLPETEHQPPTFSVQTVPEPADPQPDGQNLLQDMFAYLVYLQTHDVQSYADGRMGRRDLEALRRRLVEPDERRLGFLRHLAERLGFVGRQDEYLRLDATRAKQWLTATTGSQVATLQETWRDDATWNDLCHVPTLVCDQVAAWQNDPLWTRRALLELLARCPQDGWWSAASFVAATKETHPDFQRPDGDYSSWYIREVASGEYLSGFETWDQVEGALILDLLAGPLRWLDIVSTARTSSGLICRLTEAGTRFLNLTSEEPETAPSPPIVVRPDFRVEVPAPDNLYTRFQLERFADPECRESCYYQLTVAGLGRALGRGVRIEQILAFLRQASDGKVPANVAGQLQMWAARFDQVHLEEVILLQTKQERILRELSVLPETRPFINKVLSPTLALVRRADLHRLQKELRKLGYMPAAERRGDPEEHG